jgi:hypothetical protein
VAAALGVVAAAAAPAPVPAPGAVTLMVWAGGVFTEPPLARPMSTPTPMASSSTPTPARSGPALLRRPAPPADGVTEDGGGGGGVGVPAPNASSAGLGSPPRRAPHSRQ